jgi:hypothetical protein
MIVLALSDEGAPSFEHRITASLSAFGVPASGCTPDQSPDPMAAAIRRRDVNPWAEGRRIESIRPGKSRFPDSRP